MQLLFTAARWETILLVAAFGIITLWRLLQDGSFAGLLRSSDGTFSPGRAQLLVLTVITAVQYLITVLQNPSHLAPIPQNLVTALGGSQGLYLGAKAWSMIGPGRNK